MASNSVCTNKRRCYKGVVFEAIITCLFIHLIAFLYNHTPFPLPAAPCT